MDVLCSHLAATDYWAAQACIAHQLIRGWRIEWVSQYEAEHKTGARIVLFVLNRPPLIEAYKKRGGVLAQYAVSDASLSVMKTFKAPYSPIVYAFDPDRKLVQELNPHWTAYEEAVAEIESLTASTPRK